MKLPIPRNHFRLFAIGLLLITLTGQAAAQTGLPLPRFVSLRASEVNMRTGPGVRYPIQWKLVYRHMPVEIVAEFENWRKIREWEGSVGWVHKSMLSGQRWVIIRKGKQTLRGSTKPDAPVVARIEKKVIGKVEKCDARWGKIDF